MSGSVDSPKRRLCQLENQSRRQVFEVIYITERTAEAQIREINAFCRLLLGFLPAVQYPGLIQSKNQEIKRIRQLVRLKVRKVLLKYLELKAEMQAVHLDVHSPLHSELFREFPPAFFHQSMLPSTDPDLPFLPFHASVSVVLPVTVTLARVSELYEILREIDEFKRNIKGFLHCNGTVDMTNVLETCRKLENTACAPVFLLNSQWNLCLSASEVIFSHINLAKARLCHIHSSLYEDRDPLSFETDLEVYVEDCLTLATHCRDEENVCGSGYWLQVAHKIRKFLDISSFTVDIYYGEALISAEKHSKGVFLLKSVLKAMNSDLYDESYDSTRAYIMAKVASAHDDLSQYERAVKWYHRALSLEDLADRSDTAIQFSYVLGTLCRYEEAETVLTSLREEVQILDPGLCNALGFLYLNWEKWEQCEWWLGQGLALPCENKDNLSFNLFCLYIHQGKLEEAQQVIEKYLRNSLGSRLNREYALLSLAHCYIEQQEWGKARKYLDKASTLQEKWKDTYYAARTQFFSGLLSIETGEYAHAETALTAALDFYRTKRLLESLALASCALAEVYIQTARVQTASNVLTAALELTELIHGKTAHAALFAKLGKVGTGMQDFAQARTWLDTAVHIQETVIPHSKATAQTYTALGRLELAVGRDTEAYEWLLQAVQRQGTCVSAAETYSGLAELYERKGDRQSAQGCVEEGLQRFQSFPQHPLAEKLRKQLESLI